MKAIIRVGVRKQGRLVGWERGYVSIMEHTVKVPEDFIEKQLAIGVAIGEIMRAQHQGPGLSSDELDTLEVTVDFEGDEYPAA